MHEGRMSGQPFWGLFNPRFRRMTWHPKNLPQNLLKTLDRPRILALLQIQAPPLDLALHQNLEVVVHASENLPVA
jgi:hypothetical protein